MTPARQTSLTGYDKPLKFDLKVSPRIVTTLALLHGGAMGSILVLPAPWLVRLAGLVLIAASAWHHVRLHGLRRGRWAVTALDLPADPVEPVLVTTQAGEDNCKLHVGTLQSWLVLLRLRCGRGRRRCTILITADSLDPEAFRRLRVLIQQRIATD